MSDHLGGAEDAVEAIYQLEQFGVSWLALELRHDHVAVGPRILEGHDLGRRILALVLLEEEIVVAGGVERGIEIDEIGDFVRDRFIHALAPEPDKIIAVVELINEVGHG